MRVRRGLSSRTREIRGALFSRCRLEERTVSHGAGHSLSHAREERTGADDEAHFADGEFEVEIFQLERRLLVEELFAPLE